MPTVKEKKAVTTLKENETKNNEKTNGRKKLISPEHEFTIKVSDFKSVRVITAVSTLTFPLQTTFH